MNISKTGEAILAALAESDRVDAEVLSGITPSYKAEINALKKEGANIRAFQDKTTGKIFFMLDMVEGGQDTPPDVRPPATSLPPAAPTSGSSPAESPPPPAETSEETEDSGVVMFVLSDPTIKSFPKTGRMKIEGWIEDLTEKRVVNEYVTANPASEYFVYLCVEDINSEAQEAVEEETKTEAETVENPKEAIEESPEDWPAEAQEAEKPVPRDTESAYDTQVPPPAEVPIYDETGAIIGYKRVEAPPPAKTKEEIREEVKDSDLSTASSAGMEGLLDKGPAGAPDDTI